MTIKITFENILTVESEDWGEYYSQSGASALTGDDDDVTWSSSSEQDEEDPYVNDHSSIDSIFCETDYHVSLCEQLKRIRERQEQIENTTTTRRNNSLEDDSGDESSDDESLNDSVALARRRGIRLRKVLSITKEHSTTEDSADSRKSPSTFCEDEYIIRLPDEDEANIVMPLKSLEHEPILTKSLKMTLRRRQSRR